MERLSLVSLVALEVNLSLLALLVALVAVGVALMPRVALEANMNLVTLLPRMAPEANLTLVALLAPEVMEVEVNSSPAALVALVALVAQNLDLVALVALLGQGSHRVALVALAAQGLERHWHMDLAFPPEGPNMSPASLVLPPSMVYPDQAEVQDVT